MSDVKPDPRPANCRFRLQEEGKAHPKSGCQVNDCKFGKLTGKPEEEMTYLEMKTLANLVKIYLFDFEAGRLGNARETAKLVKASFTKKGIGSELVR